MEDSSSKGQILLVSLELLIICLLSYDLGELRILSSTFPGGQGLKAVWSDTNFTVDNGLTLYF